MDIDLCLGTLLLIVLLTAVSAIDERPQVVLTEMIYVNKSK